MKKIFALLASATCGCAAVFGQQSLLINEVMQSNIDCMMDDLNNFPDSWVELFNGSDESVNLGEYYLGTSKKPAKAWKLPDMEVPSGGYVVVYCDKESTGLHTSFRLESGKDCEAYLFHGEEMVDCLPEGMKKQPAPNIAYGRETDGSDKWGYMVEATPGIANCGGLVKKLLPDPVFSVPGRVGMEPLTLSITLPEDAPEGSLIHYTLDGKEPTSASPVWNGDLYLDTTMVVRAVAICDGYMTPRSVAHSYIFEPNDTPLQFVSIVIDGDYMYDPEIGIYVTGNDPDNPNYTHDWRRPANIEFFVNKNEPSVINQLGEIRVKGGATRNMPVKSLVLYANKRFGQKRFNHEFFPDLTPGISEFKSVELRNTGNDYPRAMMRDVVIQESFGRNVDLDWAPHQSMVVYINGKYVGFQNLRPRSNEDFIAAYYDGLEDVDVIENWMTAKEGDIENFKSFQKFYSEDGHSLEEYEEWMDVNEFLNLFIMNIFYDNKDWPANNMILWRPLADGGRWRWIAKDTDMGLGYSGLEWKWEYPTLKWMTGAYSCPVYNWGNSEKGTELFNHFLSDEECRKAFIDRAAVYMGDFLRPERITELIEKERAEIASDVERLIAKEKEENLITRWWKFDTEVNEMKEWVKGRTESFYNEMSEVFELGRPVKVKINPELKEAGNISVNSLRLSEPWFDGKWFAGSTLRVSSDDSSIDCWTVSRMVGDEKYSTVVPGREAEIEIPECDALVIVPESYSGVEITEYDGLTEGAEPCWYTLQGLPVAEPQPGQLLIRVAGGHAEKVQY